MRIWGLLAMDDFLAYRRIDAERSLYISSLSKSAVSDNNLSHLGDSGFFLYECSPQGIEVLAKVASFEAALRLMELLEAGVRRAVRFNQMAEARTARRLAA
jgi:hypothetical protein